MERNLDDVIRELREMKAVVAEWKRQMELHRDGFDLAHKEWSEAIDELADLQDEFSLLTEPDPEEAHA